MTFEDVFQTGDPARDAFLSRLFGLFSETTVHHWCAHPTAPYENLGRPSLFVPGRRQPYVLDFTLRHRTTGKVFVTEMKAELQYDNYRFLRLVDPAQVRHHEPGAAFQHFLTLTRDPTALPVKVNGRQTTIHGTILVWGAITSSGREAVQSAYGFADVLSTEAMIADLHRWAPDAWRAHVARLWDWSRDLFTYLGPDALLGTVEAPGSD